MLLQILLHLCVEKALKKSSSGNAILNRENPLRLQLQMNCTSSFFWDLRHKLRRIFTISETYVLTSKSFFWGALRQLWQQICVQLKCRKSHYKGLLEADLTTNTINATAQHFYFSWTKTVESPTLCGIWTNMHCWGRNDAYIYKLIWCQNFVILSEITVLHYFTLW